MPRQTLSRHRLFWFGRGSTPFIDWLFRLFLLLLHGSLLRIISEFFCKRRTKPSQTSHHLLVLPFHALILLFQVLHNFKCELFLLCQALHNLEGQRVLVVEVLHHMGNFLLTFYIGNVIVLRCNPVFLSLTIL